MCERDKAMDVLPDPDGPVRRREEEGEIPLRAKDERERRGEMKRLIS